MQAATQLRETAADSATFIQQLGEFVSFPSISTDPRYAGAVKGCATWLADHLTKIGLQGVTVFPTPRHPVVYAERIESPALPTLLIYGHYDVVPVAPRDAWTVPPFAGVVRGDKLYGRGASDDKGQTFIHLKAIEGLLRRHGRLPVNVKLLIEGEEEIGSPHLAAFIQKHRELLRADWALLSDTNMLAPGRPSLTYALRGSLSVELEVRGPSTELHSGIFGGAVHNPLQALSEILAGLHTSRGQIAIPGFYDEVQPVPAAERAYLRRFATPDEQLLREAGVQTGWGEKGYSLYERTTIRPSLSITGIAGGYQGEGVKSVVPAQAGAKLNFRLVPGQDPHKVEALLREHLRRVTPPGVQTELRALLHAPAAQVPVNHPVMQAARRACQIGFSKEAVLQRSGGTIPAVGLFGQLLGIPTVLLGFGLPNDRKHGPDEFFYLPTFLPALRTSMAMMQEVGKLRG